MECELEADLLRPIPKARERIQAARDQGHRVLFVSDMYMPARFIQAQLERHDMWAKGDKIYVSCEHGKSKILGDLFPEITYREHVLPNQVIHFGNDWKADVRRARQAGLEAEHFPDGNLNRYEQILEAFSWPTGGFSSVMAGTSRLARLTVPASNPREKAIREVAAGVVAPVLVGYILWLLRRAQQLDQQRLYFIARDGQFLLEITRRLAKRLNVSLDLRYLYGSRQAWNLPSITHINEEQLNWIWVDVRAKTKPLSVNQLLSRVGLDPQEISESLNTIGLAEEDWSRNLSSAEREALQALLQKDHTIHESILQKASRQRQVTMKYLTQEGLLDPIRWSIVDVGWRGTLQNSLTRILTTAYDIPFMGFYFALLDNSEIKHSDNREAYFFNEGLKFGLIDSLPRRDYLPIYMEAFCCANHGTVISLVEDGEKIRLALKEECDEKVMDWGLAVIREMVYCFIENLPLSSDLINVRTDMRAAFLELLKTFWMAPSRVEAGAWGAFPWDGGVGRENYTFRLAESYRWSQVIKACFTGRMPRHHLGTWIEGSVALSPPAMRLMLKGILSVAAFSKGPWGRYLKHMIGKFVNHPAELLGDIKFKIQHFLAKNAR